MPGPQRPLRLGLSLDGVGAHPAARRLPGATDGLDDAQRLVDLTLLAESAVLDFVSLGDSFDPPTDGDSVVPARLDALLALARVAPSTTSIGLIPTVSTTHTEPFHVSKNVATLDLVSAGRGGWQVAVSTSEEAARRFGRKDVQPIDELWEEAEDAIEVVSRLWDSWEDDAVIRDRPTGRYIDRDKLHYVDFEGTFFSVRGPSITPRSPQGQPIVMIAADDSFAAAVAVRRADIVVVDAADRDQAHAARTDLRARAAEIGRDPEDLTVLVDVRVGEPGLRGRLNALHGTHAERDGLDLVADATDVAQRLAEWHSTGAADGFLVRPDALATTAEWFVHEVVPLLRRRGATGTRYDGRTLRDHLGLDRPASRYAAGVVVSGATDAVAS